MTFEWKQTTPAGLSLKDNHHDKHYTNQSVVTEYSKKDYTIRLYIPQKAYLNYSMGKVLSQISGHSCIIGFLVDKISSETVKCV